MPLNESSEKEISGQEDIIVLHGDNQLAINECISLIISQSGGFADLNTSRLHGGEAGQTEISTQLNMLPLGAEKRKLIVDHAQEILKGKENQKWIKSLLKTFPPSNQLILVVDDEKKYNRGSWDWGTYTKKHWFRKALQSFSGESIWKELSIPDAKTLPSWIEETAENLGGHFHPAAAHTLSKLIGNDVFQAQQEIQKAIAYVGEGQQVQAEDIRLLCSATKEETIFSLVDAVGQRDGKNATRLYQELRIDMAATYIFNMLVRQVRLLLQARVLQNQKSPIKQVVEACDLRSEWQARKLINQARHFSVSELEMIYRKLNRIDEDSKTGKISIDAAVETLLVSITHT